MKYHWIGFNQNDVNKNTELKIPKQTQVSGTNHIDNNAVTNNEDGDFKPQIIQTARSSSLIVNMTKGQVKDGCSELLTRTIADVNLLELAVGDCVISNYRDPIIETHFEEGTIKSTKSRQAQIKKAGMIKSCYQNINLEKTKNKIEKELLLGICMSGMAK